MDAWVLGEVRSTAAEAGVGERVVRGTKGVDAGAVRLHGSYRVG